MYRFLHLKYAFISDDLSFVAKHHEFCMPRMVDNDIS